MLFYCLFLFYYRFMDIKKELLQKIISKPFSITLT
jgi:hypothetical protein